MCHFSYRDSIFKNELKNQAFVMAVGFKLAKNKASVLRYGPLQLLSENSSSQDIFDSICRIRMEKLPDPAIVGNAGSFFKNPIISYEQLDCLKKQYPEIIYYQFDNKIKLAAGWLIDQCGLKNSHKKGARIHPKQALVLINDNNASAMDIIQLALYVRKCVFERYGVKLEHEVRFIGSDHEVYLDQFMDDHIERS